MTALVAQLCVAGDLVHLAADQRRGVTGVAKHMRGIVGQVIGFCRKPTTPLVCGNKPVSSAYRAGMQEGTVRVGTAKQRRLAGPSRSRLRSAHGRMAERRQAVAPHLVRHDQQDIGQGAGSAHRPRAPPTHASSIRTTGNRNGLTFMRYLIGGTIHSPVASSAGLGQAIPVSENAALIRTVAHRTGLRPVVCFMDAKATHVNHLPPRQHRRTGRIRYVIASMIPVAPLACRGGALLQGLKADSPSANLELDQPACLYLTGRGSAILDVLMRENGGNRTLSLLERGRRRLIAGARCRCNGVRVFIWTWLSEASVDEMPAAP